jgi:dienelactone hydrolase
MIEARVNLHTADGPMDTFYPEQGGPYAAVCFLMDAHGIREELRDMVRRFATVGDDMQLPNFYDRERGKRSGHSRAARVAEQVDEYLARWTPEPRVLITVTPERMTTRAARRR